MRARTADRRPAFEVRPGFLVAFALKKMPQLWIGCARQLERQFVNPREERAQVRFWIGGGKRAYHVVQFNQCLQDSLFGLVHDRGWSHIAARAATRVNCLKLGDRAE